MKKYILLLPLLILGASIAGVILTDDGKSDPQPEEPQVKKKTIQVPERNTLAFEEAIPDYFSLAADEAVTYKNMKVYPIKASEQYLTDHNELEKYLNLAEAVAQNKVRIMEMGQSSRGASLPEDLSQLNPLGGNFDPSTILPEHNVSDEMVEAMEAGASVNSLTIENTSDEPVYIMAGDVVIGGNQDRVIAEDMIAMPNSGKVAVPVFCVEPGRWSPRQNPSKNAPVVNKKTTDGVFAFTGYFNVASNSIRQTVKHEKDQGEVWNKVGTIRSSYNINGEKSSTYGDLARSKRFTQKRDDYLNRFEGLFDNTDDVVGCVVVSGDKVLGVDVFGTSDLFKKQYKVLLHAYVSDAVTFGKEVKLSEEQVQNYFNRSSEKYFTKQEDNQKELDLKFVHDERVVHFTDIE